MFTTEIGRNLEAIQSGNPIGFYLHDNEEWEKVFIYYKDIPELVRFLVSQMKEDEND